MTGPAPVIPGRSELTILHIADTRFRVTGAGEEGARLRRDLTKLAEERGLRPGLLVVTGDLTENALPGEYREATSFLAALAESTGIPRRHVVVVPGSHDVNRQACQAHFLIQESQGEEPVPPYFPKWAQYRDALAGFYDEAGDTFTPDEPWTLAEMPGLGVVVAGLNSTIAESHLAQDRYGFIGEDQLRWFAARLAAFKSQGWLRLAAISDGQPRDAAELDRALTAPGLVHLALTGQQAATAGGYEFLTVRRDGLTRHTRRRQADEARSFADATLLFPPPAADAAPGTAFAPRDASVAARDISFERSRPGAGSFIDEVVRATRARFPSAKVTTRSTGATAYLRVTAPPSDGPVQPRLVGVVDGPVTEEVLDQFTAVHRQFAAADPSIRSEFVYSGIYAPEALVVRAWRGGIVLRSIIEYQGLLDLRPLAARQSERLASDPVYPAEHYVDQRFTVVAGGSEPPARVREGLIGQAIAWLADDNQRLIVVLGDFGRGKTAFLRQLTRLLPRELPGLTPVLVELRTLEKAPTLDELLAQHLVRQDVGDFSLAKLRYMINSGRVALLFDGFDELELRVGYDNATDYLQTLLTSIEGRAKVVLTGRTQHFRSTSQVRTSLGARAETRTGSRVVILEDFTEEQILTYLVRLYDGDATRARRRLDLISDVAGLMDLARNPRMLAFVGHLEEERLRQVRAREGQLSAAALYAEIIDHWLGIETSRVTHHLGTPALTKDELFAACTTLALRMWGTSHPTISLHDLTAEITDTLTRLSERGYTDEQAAHSVASGSLLIRTDDDTFAFIHLSVMEWLVAAEAARRLSATRSPSVLESRVMSPLMIAFFSDLARPGEATGWARKTLTAPDAPQPAKLNALAVLDRLAPAGASQDLSGIDLRHADLNGRDLQGAVLRDSVLRGMRLDRVNLAGADLTGADLRGVVMTEGSLREAALAGSQWDRAAILGTDVGTDPGTAELAELAPAAIAGRDAAQVMSATSAGTALCVTYSPDGSLLAHGSGPLIMMTDAATGDALRVLGGHQGEVTGVAFSPDGTRAGTASSDGTARIWDTVTGQPLSTLTGHAGPVTAVTFSPDGTLIATASNDRTARTWTADGSPVTRFSGHWGQVYATAFSPDGTLIATASNDRTARTWTADGSPVTRFSGHGGPVTAIAFSPDGTRIATASFDGTARTWDTVTGQPLSTLTGHAGPVTAVTFSPDGTLIATASNDRTARTWTAADGTARNTLSGHGGPVTAVTFSPDGTLIATASAEGAVRIWDAATSQRRTTLARKVSPLTATAFAPNASLVAAASGDGTARVWDAATGTARTTLTGHTDALTAVAFSPDSTLLATASDDGTARVWDAATGTARTTLTGHTDALTAVAFSPDSTLLATASDDFTVRLWDLATSLLRATLVGHQGRVYDVAFSPDGGLIATASHDRTTRLLDTGTGEAMASLGGHDGPVTAVAFSPDGGLIATVSTDQVARVWAGFRSPQSADGSYPRLSQSETTLHGHTGTIHAVAFSPDGSLLATASSDGTARIWTVTSATMRGVLTGHNGPVTAVAFSPDGALVGTTSDDGTLRLWEVATGALVATLLPFPDGGQAILLPDGSYKIDGDPCDHLWWVMKLCRFAPGELDPYLPEIRRLPADTPIVP